MDAKILKKVVSLYIVPLAFAARGHNPVRKESRPERAKDK
jgi:hypothetical protein